MILREWRGRAENGRPQAYPMHFRARVLPELRGVPGFLGADLLRRDLPDAIEFTVVTRWASMDAIRAFAGEDATKAVVEPNAVAALRDYDDRVSHYDVLAHVSPGTG